MTSALFSPHFSSSVRAIVTANINKRNTADQNKMSFLGSFKQSSDTNQGVIHQSGFFPCTLSSLPNQSEDPALSPLSPRKTNRFTKKVSTQQIITVCNIFYQVWCPCDLGQIAGIVVLFHGLHEHCK